MTLELSVKSIDNNVAVVFVDNKIMLDSMRVLSSGGIVIHIGNGFLTVNSVPKLYKMFSVL